MSISVSLASSRAMIGLTLGDTSPYISHWLPSVSSFLALNFNAGSFDEVLRMLWASLFPALIVSAAATVTNYTTPTAANITTSNNSTRSTNATLAQGVYTTNTKAALNTLQKWYNNGTGLYNTTGWYVQSLKKQSEELGKGIHEYQN